VTTGSPAEAIDPGFAADDLQHLRLLAIFHYVLAAIAALFSLLPGIGIAVGVVILTASPESPDLPRQIAGWAVIGIALAVMLLGFAFATLLAWVGRSLDERRNYTLCLVVAVTLCLSGPLAILLGVFTLIVLVRPSVRARFGVP
jgi:hypothetical protein